MAKIYKVQTVTKTSDGDRYTHVSPGGTRKDAFQSMIWGVMRYVSHVSENSDVAFVEQKLGGMQDTAKVTTYTLDSDGMTLRADTVTEYSIIWDEE